MTRKPKKTRLPDKPSALILLALKDLAAVERSKEYMVNMGQWHRPMSNGRCSVCLAGAVMSKSLKAKGSDYLFPSNFSTYKHAKLLALDYFREGEIQSGLNEMGVSPVDLRFDDISVARYADNQKQFKSDMRAMAARLRRFGL